MKIIAYAIDFEVIVFRYIGGILPFGNWQYSNGITKLLCVHLWIEKVNQFYFYNSVTQNISQNSDTLLLHYLTINILADQLKAFQWMKTK